MTAGESKYIERKSAAPRYGGGARQAATTETAAAAPDARQLKEFQTHCRRVAEAIAGKCGLEFRGRILELGAGGAWLSAELSKLPRVVEIVATDFEEEQLREEAPRVFAWLKARASKITRLTMEGSRLDFPDRHFDFILTVGALQPGRNLTLLLKECHRLLKPGGSLVAVREPVEPLPKDKPRSRRPAAEQDLHSVAEYETFFTRAGFTVKVRDLKLTGRWRYHYDRLVKGVLHARHAIIGTKVGRR